MQRCIYTLIFFTSLSLLYQEPPKCSRQGCIWHKNQSRRVQREVGKSCGHKFRKGMRSVWRRNHSRTERRHSSPKGGKSRMACFSAAAEHSTHSPLGKCGECESRPLSVSEMEYQKSEGKRTAITA